MELLSALICTQDRVQSAESLGLICSDPVGVSLEIETQRNLACPVSAVLRGLNALDNAKGRGSHVGRRRGEIWVVEEIGEGAFEAEAHALGEMKCFGEAGGDGGGAGALENTDTAVSDWT